MTDAEMRRRMAREVLKATCQRLHGCGVFPLGIDPKTGELFKTMPVIKVLPPEHINEDENNISDLHDYDDLDSRVDATTARGA